MTTIRLSWESPDAGADGVVAWEIHGVHDAAATAPTPEGITVSETQAAFIARVQATTFYHGPLTPGQIWAYWLYQVDFAGNFSDGLLAVAQVPTLPTEWLEGSLNAASLTGQVGISVIPVGDIDIGKTTGNLSASRINGTISLAVGTSGILPVDRGGTGGTSGADARANLGLARRPNTIPIVDKDTITLSELADHVNLLRNRLNS